MRLRRTPILLAMGFQLVLGTHTFAETYWFGPRYRGLARENAFEFAEKPTFRKAGKDRYAIAFSLRTKCDVTVAIHDPSGKIVRYLVSGVIGDNAPPPLEPKFLDQEIIWDGKDEWGKYVENPEECIARVSLGLTPRVEKVMCWHPKDITGNVRSIGADKDGVYVVCAPRQVKVFGHDTKYLRTIYPWPADKYAEGMVIGDDTGWAPGGNNFPRIGGYVGLGWPEGTAQLAVGKGNMIVFTGGWRAIKKVVRLGTDGTSRMQSIVGPTISRGKSHIYGSVACAISPDRKWIYVVPLGGGKGGGGAANCRHAVYRLGWNADGPIREPYIGEEGPKSPVPGNDNRHLNNPTSILCDSKGRIHIADLGNNRIQVFEPEKGEAKHIKTIRCPQPRQIAVHHSTGEIYVYCYGKTDRYGKGKSKVVKLGGFDDPKKLAEWDMPTSGPHSIFCLDSWADPPRFWMGGGSNVQVYQAEGKEMKLVNDFTDEVRKAGYNPHMHDGGNMTKVIPKPGGGPVYYELSKGGTIRMVDSKEGKKLMPVYREWGGTFNCDEIHCGYDGFFYVRGCAWVGRFKHPTEPYSHRGGLKGVRVRISDEVPFDYGERMGITIGHSGHGHLRGVIRLKSSPGGNFFNMGFGVTTKGDILALCEYSGKAPTKGEDGGYMGNVAADMLRKMMVSGWRPRIIPGVRYTGQLVWVWDRRGELKGENIVPTPPPASAGLRGDREGNIYVGLGYRPRDGKGKRYPFDGSGVGTVAKFPPKGGLIFGSKSPLYKEGMVPIAAGGYGNSPVWARNLLWKYPGYGIMPITDYGRCTCPNGRFDVDIYGRSFIPEHWRHGIVVLDTNGNLIVNACTYGNADSGQKKGERPTVAFVPAVGTDHDRHLYIADTGNLRIVQAKLTYAVVETARLSKR